MIHPHSELRFINNEIGYGVVATHFIPKGTITWALDKLDREFSALEIEEMDPIYKDILSKYCFRNNMGQFVLCWDNGRFVNHSFNSNCLTTAYNFEIAIRDIHEGEELTDDYGYLNVSEPFRGIEEGTRRKIVYPDDLKKYHKIWDNKILKAIKRAHKVDQPLRELVDDDTWNHVIRIAKGKDSMQSILNVYYEHEENR
jgi:hypothetical protein